MAIYHLSVSRISRRRGQSSVAASAYRNGVELHDERTGITHDYRNKRGVLFSNLIAPSDCLDWSRSDCWNQIELAETRSNSCPARDCVVAIPIELKLADQLLLAESMGQWISQRHQVIVDWAMHKPVFKNDLRNIHVHYLISTRRVSANGVGEKSRELDSRSQGPLEIRAWRKRWEELANQALAHQAIDSKIDHRSHVDRGIYEMPTIKEGRGPGAALKKKKNEEIRAINTNLRLHNIKNFSDLVRESDDLSNDVSFDTDLRFGDTSSKVPRRETFRQ